VERDDNHGRDSRAEGIGSSLMIAFRGTSEVRV
jgi:hypothetical protein